MAGFASHYGLLNCTPQSTSLLPPSTVLPSGDPVSTTQSALRQTYPLLPSELLPHGGTSFPHSFIPVLPDKIPDNEKGKADLVLLKRGMLTLVFTGVSPPSHAQELASAPASSRPRPPQFILVPQPSPPPYQRPHQMLQSQVRVESLPRSTHRVDQLYLISHPSLHKPNRPLLLNLFPACSGNPTHTK